jgi:hypothetical protein
MVGEGVGHGEEAMRVPLRWYAEKYLCAAIVFPPFYFKGRNYPFCLLKDAFAAFSFFFAVFRKKFAATAVRIYMYIHKHMHT